MCRVINYERRYRNKASAQQNLNIRNIKWNYFHRQSQTWAVHIPTKINIGTTYVNISITLASSSTNIPRFIWLVMLLQFLGTHSRCPSSGPKILADTSGGRGFGIVIASVFFDFDYRLFGLNSLFRGIIFIVNSLHLRTSFPWCWWGWWVAIAIPVQSTYLRFLFDFGDAVRYRFRGNS